MELVWLTALGVGGATMIGSVIGFLFKKASHKFSDIVLSFAAGGRYLFFSSIQAGSEPSTQRITISMSIGTSGNQYFQSPKRVLTLFSI